MPLCYAPPVTLAWCSSHVLLARQGWYAGEDPSHVDEEPHCLCVAVHIDCSGGGSLMLAHTIWLLPPILAIVGGAWLLVPARGAHRWRSRVMPWVEPATPGVNRRSFVRRVRVAQRLRAATAAERLAVGGSCALAMLVAGLTHRPLVAVPVFVVLLCTAQMMAKGIARSAKARAQARRRCAAFNADATLACPARLGTAAATRRTRASCRSCCCGT